MTDETDERRSSLTEVSQVGMDAALTGIGFMLGGKRVAPEDAYILPKPCPLCNSCGWICDTADHPTKPWADQPGSGPNACGCGAGKPCPNCNELSKERRGWAMKR